MGLGADMGGGGGGGGGWGREVEWVELKGVGGDKEEEKLFFTAMKKAADEETGTAARVNPK